ncbi:hypothetical protein P1X14_07165 [Sphingomonas sp. AOB5]|uniref:hypothetical protein n=1 Tax=Sphingomonas sp. AOB5 TaxID=3034017 RepID=UPI0023F80954|nr:hypothetical protein [Sphingomonas sp. AOB5]MDF7775019.1 hypothetical protein [Sphingomonas sp. AOB5]
MARLADVHPAGRGMTALLKHPRPRRDLGNDPATLMPGALTLSYETESRFILVSGNGMWSPRQLDEHLRDFADLVDQLRRQHIRIRVLVDLKDAAIQTPEVTRVLAHGTRDCHRDGDRVALLVPGSLAKMQMRRILGTRHHNYFVSESAARLWLSASDWS